MNNRYGPVVDTDRGVAIECDFSPSTLDDEDAAGGWISTTQSYPPRADRLITAGMRGEPRPGPNDDDD